MQGRHSNIGFLTNSETRIVKYLDNGIKIIPCPFAAVNSPTQNKETKRQNNNNSLIAAWDCLIF